MAQKTGANVLMKEQTVFDADVHLSVGSEELASYMDEPYKSRTDNSYSWPATSGADWDPMMGGKIESRSLSTPDEIEEELVEKFHIDYPIVNILSGISRLPDTDLAVNLMSAYNDILIDKFLDPTELHGLALMASQDPDACAQEIDRLSNEDQIVGLLLYPTTPHKPLGDSDFDVMYQAAEDNGLHIAYHAGAATSFRYQFPIQNSSLEKFLEIHTLTHLWSQTLTLTSLIVQGTPEKFPNLNFTFLEAGIGWVPYMMWRLNKEYAIRRSEAPLLTKSPEEYIRDQFYFASQPLGEPNNPAQMRQMIDLVGVESVMFASDYPHWDFDHPDELTKHLKNTFTKEEREQILCNTPAEAFGIDI